MLLLVPQPSFSAPLGMTAETLQSSASVFSVGEGGMEKADQMPLLAPHLFFSSSHRSTTATLLFSASAISLAAREMERAE